MGKSRDIRALRTFLGQEEVREPVRDNQFYRLVAVVVREVLWLDTYCKVKASEVTGEENRINSDSWGRV